jgi:hypothetical protein
VELADNAPTLRALRQNASAFIIAKFTYRTNDGTEKRVEADFTRDGVIFTGEKMPDGRKADAVYITLNDPYREVLNAFGAHVHELGGPLQPDI